MRVFYYSAALCLLLSACTTVDDDKARFVNVITAGLAQHCTAKGSVSSEAPYFGVFTDSTRDKLVELAKESAVRLEANALVLDQAVEQDRKYTLSGKAYSCAQ